MPADGHRGVDRSGEGGEGCTSLQRGQRRRWEGLRGIGVMIRHRPSGAGAVASRQAQMYYLRYKYFSTLVYCRLPVRNYCPDSEKGADVARSTWECSGCGEVFAPKKNDKWRTVRVEITSVDGAPQLDEIFELCPDCQSRLMKLANPAKWPKAQTRPFD